MAPKYQQTILNKKPAILTTLDKLRDNDALLMHQWEPRKGSSISVGGWPEFSREGFRTLPKDKVLEQLADIPLLSMTSVPHTNATFSVCPFQVVGDMVPTSGYFVRALDTAKDPTIIIRASSFNLDSGEDLNKKRLLFNKKRSCDPELNEFYDGLNISNDTLMQGIAESIRQGKLTNQKQLRLLNKVYDQEELVSGLKVRHFENIATHNEAVVAAPESEIMALYVPVLSRELTPQFSAMLKLKGALDGLMHIQKGENLPVVQYHVSNPYKNQISYIGQGREELTRVSLGALEHLEKNSQKSQLYMVNRDFQDHIRNQLGIEFKAPLSTQKAYTDLRKEFPVPQRIPGT